MEHLLPLITPADPDSDLQISLCTLNWVNLIFCASHHIFPREKQGYVTSDQKNSYVDQCFQCEPLLRDRVSITRTDVIITNVRLAPAFFIAPFFFFFPFLNYFLYHTCWAKLNYPVQYATQKPICQNTSAETQDAVPCQTERWEVFKRAVCQLKQLVSVWTRSAQEEHIRQCTDEQRHMTKCQIYLTANSFLWSGTEYMKRISLLQCVWQWSLVFSIVKHVPDDHPCVNPDSEQS